MIRSLFVIFIVGILFASCGVKDRPEYKSQYENIKVIQLT